MEENHLTRAFLESLTTGDLEKIADNLGVDVPDNPDRISFIAELLEAGSDDNDSTANPAEQDLKISSYVESVPLPKCYNITYIDVMIRDPFWAFVFWEIKSSEKEQMEKSADFNGYYLKVTPLWEPNENELDDVFTVQVKPDDTAWYLGFDPAAEAGCPGTSGKYPKGTLAYKVELCAAIGGAETILAVSSPVKLPGLPELPNKAENAALSGNPLVCLSGYGAFHVLRRNERPLKTKGSAPAQTNE